MPPLPTTRAKGLCFVGVDAALITIEGRFEPAAEGRTEVHLTGLPDPVIRESRSRVTAALQANRLRLPPGRLYVHLAPAGVRKSGEALDLPLALCVAACTGYLEACRVEDTLCLGELGIDGRLQDVPGGLAAAELARREGLGTVLAPPGTAREAALLGTPVRAAGTLAEALRWAASGEGAPLARPGPSQAAGHGAGRLDAIRGHAAGKRALAIAAAGGHGLLMIGPPGTGKSLLARGLLRLLDPPTPEERIEITKIHSTLGRSGLQGAPNAGGSVEGALLAHRPFRAPHHSTSLPGLVGGGSPIAPGEITLAHRGLLFLDELPEFRRDALEALRQPLETGQVLIARAGRRLRLPAEFRLVAAMNPCPCGYRGEPRVTCRCSAPEVHRYRRRISGPLLDRIELRLEVRAPNLAELAGEPTRPRGSNGAADSIAAAGLDEASLRRRVGEARALQRERQGDTVNAHLDAGALDRFAPLGKDTRRFLGQVERRRLLSARGLQALRRVARTLADLEGRPSIVEEDLAQAVALRAPLLE